MTAKAPKAAPLIVSLEPRPETLPKHRCPPTVAIGVADNPSGLGSSPPTAILEDDSSRKDPVVPCQRLTLS